MSYTSSRVSACYLKLLVLATAVALLSGGPGLAQTNVAENTQKEEPVQGQVSPVEEIVQEEPLEAPVTVLEDPAKGKVPPSSLGNVAEAPVVTVQPPAGLPPDAGAPVTATPPVRSGSGGGFFTEEERERLGLPSFVEEESGFIPDTRPEDLFTGVQGREQRSFVFDTLLGDPKVPSGSASTIIDRYGRNPSAGLGQNQARIVVPDGDITGSTETKQFRVEGGLVIYYADVSISAESADIDEKNEVAVLYGNVNIVDPKYTLKTDEMRIYFEEKRFIAQGFVQFKKDASSDESSGEGLEKKDRLRESMAAEQFELFCKDLYYNWETMELTALDSVRLVHPSFNGTMQRIDYNDETKEYEMSGSVILNVTDYDWIFDNDLVEEEDEDQIRAITNKDTRITCDKLVYSEESGIAEFYARVGATVKFDQEERSLEASYIEVNDQTKDLYAEGVEGKQVNYQQQDGEWLFAGGIIDRETTSEELQSVFDKPLTVTSNTFTYNFDRKRLELVGLVNMSGSDKSLRAGLLVQDETAKYFLLRENVYLKPNAESEIRAAQVYIDTANDKYTFVGLVEGQMESEDLVMEDEEDLDVGELQIQQGLFEQQGGTPQPTSGARGGSAVDPTRPNRAEQ